ncbi:hypothetical protein FRB97_009060 [Tulasnella sp. 331]|nr:hypothetical protein FRB97_009060 [Tulasnella sp. 331]
MNDSGLPPVDEGNDGLPTYAQASAEDGPSAARWNRWRGWIEKRAAERYADDPKAKVSTGWGDSFNENEDCGQGLPTSQDPPAPPAIVPPQRKLTSLTFTPELSTPTSSTSVGERLEPSNLSLHLFGSRFLPHTPDPINCVLPLPSLKIILVGTKTGLHVLDVYPSLHSQSPLSVTGTPAQTLADTVSIPVWNGEAVHQLDLLEDSPDEQGNPRGVVLALVGRPDDELYRSIRLYKLTSLAQLAKWYTMHKDHAPLELDGVTPIDLTNTSRLKKAGKPSVINKGLRSLAIDELNLSGSVAHSRAPDTIKSAIDSSGISPYQLPETPTYLRSSEPSSPSLGNGVSPSVPSLASASSASLRSSSWDIIEDLPMRWATDFVLLYSANSKPNASIISYELWKPENRKLPMKLVVATRCKILLYEAPPNERAFKFMKEFYCPSPAKSMSFVAQVDNNPNLGRGPSKLSSSVHVQEIRRHNSTPSRSHSRSAGHGTQLCIFVAFEKKAGLIRLGDSAVTEFEPFPDLGAVPSQGGPRSVREEPNKKAFLRRSLVTSMDGHSFWKGHPAWLPLVALDLPPLLASILVPDVQASTIHKQKIPDSICFVTRGRTTRVFPLPLRVTFSETHASPMMLRSFTWQFQPSAIRARVQHLNPEPGVNASKIPILQLVGFGDQGLEIQEISFNFLQPQTVMGDKGKGRASLDLGESDVVRAFADVGGSTGFLSKGGGWNRPTAALDISGLPRAVNLVRGGSASTSLTSNDSFASTLTSNSYGTLRTAVTNHGVGITDGTEGMFGWAMKGVHAEAPSGYEQRDLGIYMIGDGRALLLHSSDSSYTTPSISHPRTTYQRRLEMKALKVAFGTSLLHADDDTAGKAADADSGGVAPSISVSTTFRHKEGEYLNNWDAANPSKHVYSRYSTPTGIKAEKVLSSILKGYALTYSSGLAACSAAIAYYQPKRVAIRKGYMGTHGVLEIFKRRNSNLAIIDLDDEYLPGDLAWVETPLNPTGEARDIQLNDATHQIHAVGSKLVVDSTFGPPPLQDPFRFGADCVFHSGTKYFGGHSDLLCGVLVVKDLDVWRQVGVVSQIEEYLLSDLTVSATRGQGSFGVYDECGWSLKHARSFEGSLETWLLLRSLRTLHLRVPCQSETATALAQWLYRLSQTPECETYDGVPGGLIREVLHTSLQQGKVDFDVKAQMPGGFSPTFAILRSLAGLAIRWIDHEILTGVHIAIEYSSQSKVMRHDLKQLKEVILGCIVMQPFAVSLFASATSLGGVESLMEQRIISDPNEDGRLVRISVGLEDVQDLKEDLRQGLLSLAKAGSQERAKL